MSRKVIAVVDDMFFASKIRATAEALNIELKFARSLDQVTKLAADTPPDLVIADLHSQKIDPAQLAQTVKGSDTLESVPLLGFFSHVETELQRAALEARFDRVVPRSVFARDLEGILQGNF
jgi:PleD family two-component response regulator